MKTATRKTESMNLGTKRACPHCGTKFYDFNKDEISCPKCKTMLDLTDLSQPAKAPEPKKPKVAKTIGEDPLVETEEIATEQPGDAIESLDELDDDEDEVVEDLDVEEKEEEGY